MSATSYDEFGLFEENAAEAGLPFRPPQVARVTHGPISALRWGPPDESPAIVLVHGGAQNSHTWDTVALALEGQALLAVDLPGHGRSQWRDDHDYRPGANAPALADAVAALAPDAAVVVGMSLGGLTAAALAGLRPDLVRRLVLVDVTPGVNQDKAADIIAFVSGPETFASFDEILERTVQFNPTRRESSLRRGILHNAHEVDGGAWSWRYDRLRESPIDGDQAAAELEGLSDTLADADATGPLLLVRGSTSPVVTDDDVTELVRRRPDAEVLTVDRAGHSIQGDRPLALAPLLAGWAARPLA
ncbi:MAG: alpha/beta hydrolase [Acidimicrobiia bacterium]|nr:alpha/beta hydrolase [Acidimicrobiia bacterium]